MSSTYTRLNQGFLIDANILDNTSGNSYDISSTVQDVMIRKRYIEDVFSLFVFDIRTTAEMRDIIRDNDVSINLRISIYNLDDSNTSDSLDSDEVNEVGEFYNGKIRIYDKPYTTTVSTDDEDSDNTETSSNATPMVYYRFSGIPEDQISMNEAVMNRLYSQAEVVDAAINMITEVNANTKIHMQEPDNKDLSDIYIPPVNLIPAIKYIDNNYKFYNDGIANLFIDETGTYLYCPQSKNIPSTNIFECDVLTANATGDLENVGKTTVDSDGNIKISYRNLPAFSTDEKIMSHESGSNAVFYSYDDNFNLSTRSQENSISYTKVRYLWNPQSKKGFEDNFMQVVNNHTSMNINLANTNPGYFSPFTTVRIVSSEYPDAEGDYYISEISYMFGSGDGKHFTDSINMICIKK